VSGFEVPPYPYDRLIELHQAAVTAGHEVVDLSIGTPCDPPPEVALAALRGGDRLESYPPSIGTPDARSAAAGWMQRRFAVSADPDTELALCVGTKELVAGLPHLLRLRRPDRSVVLYPAVSYPTYAMGATLAGCRPVAVPLDHNGSMQLDRVAPADVADALCLWVNVPGNPTGAIEDLAPVAAWAETHGVTLLSDECYVEFSWSGPVAADGQFGQTVLSSRRHNTLAVHSLSKRSNFAGGRVGCYAGDPELVRYISEIRKHQGLMVPGPLQVAAAAAWRDDTHVAEQRHRYATRLRRLAAALVQAGVPTSLPAGAFYLWVAAPRGDSWGLARRLAEAAGVVSSPGEFYGPAGATHLRLAAVQPDSLIDAAAELIARADLG
jgi:aspartate/methionine/tyrosine aminotransferase